MPCDRPRARSPAGGHASGRRRRCHDARRTDAGMGPHGLIRHEVELMLAAGLDAQTTLGAASWTARTWLGLPGIEERAPADLVAFREVPRGSAHARRSSAHPLGWAADPRSPLKRLVRRSSLLVPLAVVAAAGSRTRPLVVVPGRTFVMAAGPVVVLALDVAVVIVTHLVVVLIFYLAVVVPDLPVVLCVGLCRLRRRVVARRGRDRPERWTDGSSSKRTRSRQAPTRARRRRAPR